MKKIRRFAITALAFFAGCHSVEAGGWGDSTVTRNAGAGGAVSLAAPTVVYAEGDIMVVRAGGAAAGAYVDEEATWARGTATTVTGVALTGPGKSQTTEVQQAVASGTEGEQAEAAAGSAALIKVYDLDDDKYFAYKGFIRASAAADGSSHTLKTEKFGAANAR